MNFKRLFIRSADEMNMLNDLSYQYEISALVQWKVHFTVTICTEPSSAHTFYRLDTDRIMEQVRKTITNLRRKLNQVDEKIKLSPKNYTSYQDRLSHCNHSHDHMMKYVSILSSSSKQWIMKVINLTLKSCGWKDYDYFIRRFDFDLALSYFILLFIAIGTSTLYFILFT
jgi:hypothetical protein